MYRKLNIRLLSIVFTVLLVITVIVKLMDKKHGDRTLKSVLVELNSDDVTTVKIYPKKLKGEEVKITRQGSGWFVSDGDKQYKADTTMVMNIIRMCENLKPLRMAATKKDKWASFEVTDSLATKIVLEGDGDELADVYIGKFSYRQSKNQMQQQNQYGRPQGTMNTYVRVGGEKEVYAVEGFLGMSVNRDIKDFRDKTVINGNTNEWNKIVFNYPADSSFVMIKQGDKWMIDGLMADSAAVVNYLRPLGRLQSSSFTDLAMNNPTYTVRFEGGTNPVEIKASPGTDGVSITSSMNSGTVFLEAADGNIMKKVFASKQQFMK